MGFTSGKVSKMLGVDIKTVKAWTNEFADMFGADAKGDDRTRREYSDDDLILLNTIRTERVKRTPAEGIRELLKSGYRNTQMPPQFYTVEAKTAMVQYAEVQSLRVQLGDASKEIERLRQEQREDRKRIEELNREIGKLQAKIEILEEDED